MVMVAIFNSHLKCLMSLMSTYQNRNSENHKVDILKNKIRNVQTETDMDPKNVVQ